MPSAGPSLTTAASTALPAGPSYPTTAASAAPSAGSSSTTAASTAPSTGVNTSEPAPSRSARKKKLTPYRDYDMREALGLAGPEHKDRWLFLRVRAVAVACVFQ